MTDIFDELRIIANDARGLPSADRETIKRAAEELEQVSAALVLTQAHLIKEQRRRIAVNEALLDLRQKIAKPVYVVSHFGYGMSPGPKP